MNLEFNYIDSTWKVCMPGAIVQNDLPKDETTSFIFTVFFKKADESINYMNMVYKVSVANEIGIDMDFLESVIETGDGAGGSLWIDARKSAIIGQTGNEILNYRWECSTDLKEHCESFNGSPFLYISRQTREREIILDK